MMLSAMQHQQPEKYKNLLYNANGINLLNAEANKMYKNLAGEAEARLVERRMNLTPEQRLQYYPYSQGQYGLDVPYNELIVKGLLK